MIDFKHERGVTIADDNQITMISRLNEIGPKI